MRILYFIASIGLVFYFTVVPVSGQTVSEDPNGNRLVTPTNSSEQRQVDRERRRLEDRRQRALLLINKSQTNLNSLINKISSNPDLTDDQKTRLIANIQAESAKIRELEDDIRNAGDLATIEALEDRIEEIEDNAKDLYTGVVRQLVYSNKVLEKADEVEAGAEKLAGAIEEARARGQGQNVDGLEATLGDMRKKIDDARSQIVATQETLLSLSPTNEGADDAALENAKAELKSADKLLSAARRDGRSMARELLKIYRDYLDF